MHTHAYNYFYTTTYFHMNEDQVKTLNIGQSTGMTDESTATGNKLYSVCCTHKMGT